MDLKEFVKKQITWYGQFSLKFIFENKIIFIDPFNLDDDENIKADYIFITHEHFDHLSAEDIKKITGRDTKIFIPASCNETLKKAGFTAFKYLEPGMKFATPVFTVEAIPMYNIIKTKFHPISKKWTGYVLNYKDIKIYVTGDTERIPEMKNIETDIIFLPLGQTYTMNSVEEAVECVIDTKAVLAIPVHYGMYEGNEKDVSKFCNILQQKQIDCLILNKKGKK